MSKKSKNKAAKPPKPPRFPHARKMKLKHLYPDEYYLAQLSALYHGTGGKPILIKGEHLKKATWWHERIATFPLVHRDHWTRHMDRPVATDRPKVVEVLLPRKFRNFKGKRMVMFVEPWSYSKTRKKFKTDAVFAELIKRKYLV